jgi:hypothetical protein
MGQQSDADIDLETYGLQEIHVGVAVGMGDDGVTEFVLLRINAVDLPTGEPVIPVDYLLDHDIARNQARMLNEQCDKAGAA